MILFLMIPLMLLGVAIAVVPVLWAIARDHGSATAAFEATSTAGVARSAEAAPAYRAA